MHGGLSPDIPTLDSIRTLSRAHEILHERAFCGTFVFWILALRSFFFYFFLSLFLLFSLFAGFIPSSRGRTGFHTFIIRTCILPFSYAWAWGLIVDAVVDMEQFTLHWLVLHRTVTKWPWVVHLDFYPCYRSSSAISVSLIFLVSFRFVFSFCSCFSL